MFMMHILSDNIIINDRFPSALSNKNNIIETIIGRIKDNSDSAKIDFEELFLIIDEALTNAMEHGNHWDPHKHVDVKITKTNEYISVSIEDEGTGFNIDRYSEYDAEPNLNPRGRGIQIIKHFCRPNWNNTGNKINFSIDIK
jgi:anti-sigma regulatory factor (Ser/Thr protein kinase)